MLGSVGFLALSAGEKKMIRPYIAMHVCILARICRSCSDQLVNDLAR